MLVAAFTVGCAIGGVTPLWTSLVGGGFWCQCHGSYSGFAEPATSAVDGSQVHPLAGHISDTTGSYDLVFVIYMSMAIVAGIALYLLKPPVRPTEKDTVASV